MVYVFLNASESRKAGKAKDYKKSKKRTIRGQQHALLNVPKKVLKTTVGERKGYLVKHQNGKSYRAFAGPNEGKKKAKRKHQRHPPPSLEEKADLRENDTRARTLLEKIRGLDTQLQHLVNPDSIGFPHLFVDIDEDTIDNIRDKEQRETAKTLFNQLEEGLQKLETVYREKGRRVDVDFENARRIQRDLKFTGNNTR